jgi:beta-glucosidase/6-phospho-beta-glucosidase/beta-galactosidase
LFGRYMEAEVGWFADPIAFGDYPASLRAKVGSRLPAFSAEDRALLVWSWDFLGFNFYTAQFVTDLPPSRASDPSVAWWGRDLGLLWSGDNPHATASNRAADGSTTVGAGLIGPQGESPWLFSTPGGLRNYLGWLNARYLQPHAFAPPPKNNALPGAATATPATPAPAGGRRGSALPVYVTENGCSAPGESALTTLAAQLDDKWRVAYYFEYLEAAVASVVEDGVPLAGYFAWSLLDNFEWADG